MKRKKIGLALGGGTMRGMTHIGVLEVLIENGIPIDNLVGCSSGAVVAAAYACGRLEELKEIATSLNKKDRRKVLDITLTGEGLIKGGKIKSLFQYLTAEKKFEDIEHINLAFVGTDALTGEEIVINEGNISEALEITTALPGFAPPKRYKGRMVIDGGTAMMVPTKVAYAIGAEKVVGVNVGVNRSFLTRAVGDIRKLLRKSRLAKIACPIFEIEEKIHNADEKKFLGKARRLMEKIRLLDDYEKGNFSFIEIYLLGLRAMSRDYKKGLFNARDCDVAIEPEVFHIKRLDVTRTNELIKKGRTATEKKMEEIKKIIND
ncbi:MAG: patatin-like phospholipase family protein [Patescibacteria group bacterium]|nr:patatin-like phospholipase family protein [Patescibacteria group bacterium]